MARFFQVCSRDRNGMVTDEIVNTGRARELLSEWRDAINRKSEDFTVAGAMALVRDEQTFECQFGTFVNTMEIIPEYTRVRTVDDGFGGKKYVIG